MAWHPSFPLFSKGVDTYRFEYGVFLLNKDIEMVSALFLADMVSLTRPYATLAHERAKSPRAGHAPHPPEPQEPAADAHGQRAAQHPVSIRPACAPSAF